MHRIQSLQQISFSMQWYKISAFFYNYKLLSPLQINIDKAITELLYVIIAFMGWLVRYLQHYLKSGIFHWKKFLSEMIVAWFSGYMFKIFAQSIGINSDLLFIIGWMWGHMGWRTLDILTAYIETIIHRKTD